MGVEYYVVCDDDRTGYELGKGSWSLFYEIKPFQCAADLRAAFELLIEKDQDFPGLEDRRAYLREICEEVVAYCEQRAWRVRFVNDCGDETVVDPERFEDYVARGLGDGYLFRRVGTRYRE